jgi:uncharacterized protein
MKKHLSFLIFLLILTSLACGFVRGEPTAPAATPATIGLVATPTAVAEAVSIAVEDATADTPAVADADTETTALVPVPAPGRGGEVEVIPLYVYGDGSGGVTSQMRIQVQPNRSGQLRVGFFEDRVSATGNMWQSSGWIAVLYASMFEGIDPVEFEFSFSTSTGGSIDGPSAGALMTSGVLAALRGDQVLPHVTMTGTINPDGTVGPVGGIAQKVEAAAAVGKTVVLIPAGNRYTFDRRLNSSVDAVEVGRRFNVEVIEVANIFQAYEKLTGATLPQPATGAAPALPQRAFDRAQAKSQEWLARYQRQRLDFNGRHEGIQELFIGLVYEADELANGANQATNQGLPSVAYYRAYQAAAYVEMANLAANMIERYYSSGIGGVIAMMQATSVVDQEIVAAINQFKAANVNSVSDMATLFDAYSSLSIAHGLYTEGADTVNQVSQYYAELSEEEVFYYLTQAAVYYTLSSAITQVARDTVEIGLGFGAGPLPDIERLSGMANTIDRAASANIALFEATEVEPFARNYGISVDRARFMYQNHDSHYLFANASQNGWRYLYSLLQNDPQNLAIVQLGYSQSAYNLSSLLVAKYYSLGAYTDEYGNIYGFSNERGLADMLEFAEQRARQTIAQAGDHAPVGAILKYEIARIQRQGTPEDQLDALSSYWQAALLAQVAHYLAGE